MGRSSPLVRTPSHGVSKHCLKPLATRENDKEPTKVPSKDDLCLLPKNTFLNNENKKTENTKSNEKQTNITNELVETEKKFTQTLSVLIKQFKEPLRSAQILSKELIQRIFSNIEDIDKLHKYFLNQLLYILHGTSLDDTGSDNCLGECATLAELFHKYSTVAGIFSIFCSSHSKMLTEKVIPQQLQSNSEFRKFVKTQLEIPEVNKQTLQSLLTSIPQRICKYPLLLREYLKTLTPNDPEYEEIQSALTNLNALLDEIDKCTKASSDFGALLEIQRKLTTPKNFKLVEDGRTFIHKCKFQVAKPHQNYGSYGYLFSDILILAKCKGEFHKVTRIFPLNSLILCSSTNATDLEIVIAEVSSGMFKVIFDTIEERNAWIKALNQKLTPATVVPLSPTPETPRGSRLSNLRGSVKSDTKLLTEITKRKDAETRIKELEAEVKQLKKTVKRQQKIIEEMNEVTIRKPSTPRASSLAESPRHSSPSRSIFRTVKYRFVSSEHVPRLDVGEISSAMDSLDSPPSVNSERNSEDSFVSEDITEQFSVSMSENNGESSSETLQESPVTVRRQRTPSKLKSASKSKRRRMVAKSVIIAYHDPCSPRSVFREPVLPVKPCTTPAPLEEKYIATRDKTGKPLRNKRPKSLKLKATDIIVKTHP